MSWLDIFRIAALMAAQEARIMATLSEIQADAEEIAGRVAAANTKLDEVLVIIHAFEAGGLSPEQQAQVDAIKAALDATKTELGGVESDLTDATDGPSA